MSLSIESINEVAKLGEHMNELRLVETVKQVLKRIDDLEQQVSQLQLLLGSKPEKIKKEIKNVFWMPIIYDILSNGKIWSVYAIAEAVKEKYSAVVPYAHDEKRLHQNVNTAMYKLNKDGRVEKVGHANYRKA